MDICVWGDSITYGAADAEGLGWVGRFRKTRSPEVDDDATYERGVCGDTSRGLVRRFSHEYDAMVYKPEAVAFAIGINDSSVRGEDKDQLVPLEEFRKNLESVIEEAKKRVTAIYIIGLTNVDETRTNPLPSSSTKKRFLNAEIERYDLVLQEISVKYGLTFVKLFGILENSDLADGLHPNASGYEKMFQKILPSIT